MKSFVDAEKMPVIPHLIKEVLDFKGFVKGHFGVRQGALEGHTNGQQFKFYKDSNGLPLMQFKYLCIDSDWLPEAGGGIRLWNENTDGRPLVPRSDPLALARQRGKSFDEVCKGIDEYVNLWGTMANEDLFGESRRMNEPLSYYWQGV